MAWVRAIGDGVRTSEIQAQETEVPQCAEHRRRHEVVRERVHEQVAGHFVGEARRDKRPSVSKVSGRHIYLK